MSSCPSRSIQKCILLPKIDTIHSSDKWLYGISKRWLTELKLQLENESESAVEENTCNLSPLTVEPDIENNDFISEKWWKILVSWYRLDNKAAVIRKPISSTYIHLWDGTSQHSVFIDREDFFSISVSLFGDISDTSLHKTLQVSLLDTFDFIEYQIRRLFDLSSRCRNRLWINIKENKNDIVFDTLDDFSATIVSKAAFYLPWLLKLLTDKGQNNNYRKPNDPFLFSEKNVKIFVSAETYFSAVEQSNQKWAQHSVEGEFDSILTLATVSNKWEEIFTECLDEFTNEVSDITREKCGFLINAAKDIVSEKVSEAEKLKSKLDEKLKSLEEKERKVNEKEASLNTQEEEYKTKLIKYKEGLSSFMKEKNRLETEWKKAKEQNMIKDSKITLNIGGERFTTSLTTLTNIDDTLFVQLFCGTYTAKPSEDGSYFIDRDGTHFRHILNYLRNGPKAVKSIPNQENILLELLNEARYYKMSELESLILERIEMRSVEGEMGYISYPSVASPFSSFSSFE